MSDDQSLNWFPYAFPFLFGGMWLFIMTMLGFMSGWFNLQQWYSDDGSEEPLLKLRGQSGTMGIGVAFNGCLKLRAYPSGLGIGIWRIFGPFQKPLRIPWSEIQAQPSSSFFVPMVKLHLGKPENGTLKISTRSWSRLVNAVPEVAAKTTMSMRDVPPVQTSKVAGAMFIQWLAITGLFGVLFYFTSRSQQNGPPIAVCFAFPAVIFGMGQLIRFARS